ncbi:MAG: hypothetical protein DSM106950_42180 [Stigonema ocellatum SAG 48.90 = DSM 106950]|nr:hypothetical protein [Stigonema ocellatum SAG 48.90 = DSM 106950]
MSHYKGAIGSYCAFMRLAPPVPKAIELNQISSSGRSRSSAVVALGN